MDFERNQLKKSIYHTIKLLYIIFLMFRIYDIFFCINYDNYILLLIIFFKPLIIMKLIKIVLDA